MSQYTTRTNMLWIQPDGPGGAIYPLSCADLDEIKEVETAIETLQCWNADRSGWDTIGELISPPEKISFTITLPVEQARSLLENVNCPFTLYWTQASCGKVDNFENVDRGEIIQHLRRSGRAFNAVAHHKDDTATNVAIDVEAWPKLLDIDLLLLGRNAVVETMAGNDVIGNSDLSCGDDCSTPKDIGEYVEIAPDSAPAAATANVLFSTNYGETFAAGAVDPFAAGLHIMAITRVQVGRTTTRIIVGREGTGAVQGLMAYSDNAGASWTTVNIGGAAVGHGPTFGHGLWSFDRYHIWCASADGYIYKSIDAGLSWVAKEAGIIHANDNHFVHFADKTYGLVGGAAGVISISSDGGETWTAGGIPAASPARCGWRIDKNVCWVGLDNGALYRSVDGGLTWTLQAATGMPAGALRSMCWVNEYQGFVVHNTAAPVGSVWRTNNGGASWEALTTPANSGLNSVWAPKASLVFVVGEPNGGTCTVIKGERAYV